MIIHVFWVVIKCRQLLVGQACIAFGKAPDFSRHLCDREATSWSSDLENCRHLTTTVFWTALGIPFGLDCSRANCKELVHVSSGPSRVIGNKGMTPRNAYPLTRIPRGTASGLLGWLTAARPGVPTETGTPEQIVNRVRPAAARRASGHRRRRALPHLGCCAPR